ncbi:potassium channel family protein [Pseudomonas sp. SH1-B]
MPKIKTLLELKPKCYAYAYIFLTAAYAALFYIANTALGLPDGWQNSIYLSIVTITTLGFGDITPSTELGKLVVSSEPFFGVILLGLFLNALSHARSSEIIKSEKEAAAQRKEELRKALEMHSCLLLDVFKSGNPFAWDKHAKFSAPMDDLEPFARDTYASIDQKNCKINKLQIKMLLETVDQNYDTLLSLMPVAVEISSDFVLEWSSFLSNTRNLKQQYEQAQATASKTGEITWPGLDDISLQVKELIQSCLFISRRSKAPD